MVSRTVSARQDTTSGGPATDVVATGGQNSMIQLDGSGTAPTGPSHGKSGVTGKYGSRSSFATARAFPIMG
jgi:hypothetical protein